MVKRIRTFFRTHWQLLLTVVILIVIVGLLLLFRLGSLTGGLARAEVTQLDFSSSWHHIVTNPLNAPLTALQWLANTFSGHHGQTIARLPSVLFGLLALVCLTYILRCWYGIRTAIFGAVLFGCSAWLLHVSRLATTDVMYLAVVPVLLATHIYWQRQQARRGAILLVIVALGLCMYIPGAIWLMLGGLLLQPKRTLGALGEVRRWWQWALAGLLAAGLLAPLAWSFWRTPELIHTWLGLPQTFAPPLIILKRLADSLIFPLARGPHDPVVWLDRLPIMSLFASVMVLAGALFYLRHFRAPRTRLLIGYFLIGAVLFALNGPVSISLVLPLFFILAAGGIGYLLHEWLRVFPRNPLARSIGFGLVGLVIALNCAYNLRAYFVAWPHNHATRTTFTIRR